MSGKTLQVRLDFIKLLLNATPLANVWDNAASSPIGSLYVSLHYQDPGPTGNAQTLYELNYDTYARIAVVRTTSGFTCALVSGAIVAVPVANIVFAAPAAALGSGSGLYAGIGRDVSGAGYLFMSGAITPTIIPSVGSPPTLTTASTITEA